MILVGLAAFGISLAFFHYISIPITNLSTFKNNPGGQAEINKIILMITFVMSILVTVAVLRLAYEIIYKRKK